MTDEQKMAGLGRMVFGMITDVLMLPDGEGYGRKTITTNDGHGGNHSVEIIIARGDVGDAMEEAAALRFNVTDVHGSGEGLQ